MHPVLPRYPKFPAQKVSVFRVSLVLIFSHLDGIRRDTEYLSVFNPNARKYGPKKTSDMDTFHEVIPFMILINLTKIMNAKIQSHRKIKSSIIAQITNVKLFNILLKMNDE